MAVYPCFTNETNNGYRKHIDAFKNTARSDNLRLRKVTLITYLNTPFDQNDVRVDKRGCLRLYLNDQIIDVVPRQGRCLMFMSEQLWHSVQPLHNSKDRYALTVWFNHIVKLKPPKVYPVSSELIFVAIPCYSMNKHMLAQRPPQRAHSTPGTTQGGSWLSWLISPGWLPYG